MKLKIDCENNVCAVHLSMQKYEQAKQAALRVIKMEPNEVKSNQRLVKIYLKLGELSNATKAIEKVKTLAPAYPKLEMYSQMLQVKKDQEKKRNESFAKKFQKMDLGYKNESATKLKSENVASSLSKTMNWRYWSIGMMVFAVAVGFFLRYTYS
mmetsp:Transcript_9869/g.14851  ORF Transcript_9869/g.14851 Transcript_9869/m.14851 type:complete len:154 (+) Transcript_9869:86-547(+)